MDAQRAAAEINEKLRNGVPRTTTETEWLHRYNTNALWKRLVEVETQLTGVGSRTFCLTRTVHFCGLKPCSLGTYDTE